MKEQESLSPDNRYAPAAAADSTQPSQFNPLYKLFDSTSVGLAAFLGSPVAGSTLMALNYSRMGEKSKATAAFAIGLAVTAGALRFGSMIPQYAAPGVAIALFLATRAVAKALQGASIEQHVSQGGKLGSKWSACGIGISFLVLILGGIF